jgi:hypothetical protein
MEKRKQKCGARIISLGIMLAILSLNLFACGGSGSETSSAQGDADDTEVAAVPASETPESEAEDDNVPTEYKSALNKAATYSNSMHMSKDGIYDQLVSDYGDKFSVEAAQYAVDNLEADYKANALAKAKEYSDTMYMSKAGIYDQLISSEGEKFTEDEAQYAVDNLEADYNANALEKAKQYQTTMDMSPEAIRDQLTSDAGEKFTDDEADYAIKNLD